MSTYLKVSSIEQQISAGVTTADPVSQASLASIDLKLTAPLEITNPPAESLEVCITNAAVPSFNFQLGGAVAALTTTEISPADVWVPEKQFQSVKFCSLISDQLGDVGPLGNGARTVEVTSVAAITGIVSTAEFEMDGQTGVSIGNIETVIRMRVVFSGNSKTNQGTIRVFRDSDGATFGVPDRLDLVYATIGPGRAYSDDTVFHVAAGRELQLTNLAGNCTGPAKIRLTIALPTGASTQGVLLEWFVSGFFSFPLSNVPVLEADTRIALVAASSAGTVDLSVSLTGFEIDV